LEELISAPGTGTKEEPAWKVLAGKMPKTSPVRLDQVKDSSVERIDTNDPELNRSLGGGLVQGSVVLLAGQPGIGKSTLLLQLAMSLPLTKILYVSGEESTEQIKIRAARIKGNQKNCYLLGETDIQSILQEAIKMKTELLIIDSIQTIHNNQLSSATGSISQIRECTNEIIRYAKELAVPVLIIGHITKEGDIAGPKLLEHMVDVVLHFEGDRHYAYRVLRTQKNRFGSTDELSLYEMKNTEKQVWIDG